MQESQRLQVASIQRAGYRLHKLEVLNWGTFDGQVYTIRPKGDSGPLLIGKNGSGKSTLVDALLTLLVRPGIRNFNVAAGAKKRERDERTYIRGAYDRGEDANGIEIKYLRPKAGQYSVILACFQNDEGKSFTVAQFLWLASDSVEKIYCFSDDERSIQKNFAGVESTEGIVKELRSRGFRATKTFQEFETWFTKATKVKAKAMEVFNQTVAVKDIQRLNDFIRDHMLEPRNWDEKVERLLGHFTLLTEAHESLVRVRQQLELLQPVARHGIEYQRHAGSLERAQRLLAAINAFFSQRTIDLFTPELELRLDELSRTSDRKDSLAREWESANKQSRSLQNEIEREGGERLRQIPVLIEKERACAETKSNERRRYRDALRLLEITEECDDESAFMQIQGRLSPIRRELDASTKRASDEKEQRTLERGDVRRDLTVLRQEWEGLKQRRENIPCMFISSHLQ